MRGLLINFVAFVEAIATFSMASLQRVARFPLWILFIAVQLLDMFWSIFVLLGIEKVRIVPGITATDPRAIVQSWPLARKSDPNNKGVRENKNLGQLGVLGFGFFQDGDVGVGVLPRCEEILSGRSRVQLSPSAPAFL